MPKRLEKGESPRAVQSNRGLSRKSNQPGVERDPSMSTLPEFPPRDSNTHANAFERGVEASARPDPSNTKVFGEPVAPANVIVVTNRNGPDLNAKIAIGGALVGAGFGKAALFEDAHEQALKKGHLVLFVSTWGDTKADSVDAVQALGAYMMLVRPTTMPPGYLSTNLSRTAWEPLGDLRTTFEEHATEGERAQSVIAAALDLLKQHGAPNASTTGGQQ